MNGLSTQTPRGSLQYPKWVHGIGGVCDLLVHCPMLSGVVFEDAWRGTNPVANSRLTFDRCSEGNHYTRSTLATSLAQETRGGQQLAST